MKDADISICLGVIFIAILVFITTWSQAWGEEHEINISWKEQQLQEKFNNVNASGYTSYEKQIEKVQQTRDYLEYWGWLDRYGITIQVAQNHTHQHPLHNGNGKSSIIETEDLWKIDEGDILYINIVNGEEHPAKAKLIREAILSDKKLIVPKEVFNEGEEGMMTYYLGWVGALEHASKVPTEFYIPKNLKVIEEPNGSGEIIITLLKEEHERDIAGLITNTIMDNRNEIIKSEITIYKIDQISDRSLQVITRHEMGHAFGLAHSNDPDDLMYETLQTLLPYISQCNTNAITLLYDGLVESEVLCVKLKQ